MITITMITRWESISKITVKKWVYVPVMIIRIESYKHHLVNVVIPEFNTDGYSSRAINKYYMRGCYIFRHSVEINSAIYRN